MDANTERALIAAANAALENSGENLSRALAVAEAAAQAAAQAIEAFRQQVETRNRVALLLEYPEQDEARTIASAVRRMARLGK